MVKNAQRGAFESPATCAEPPSRIRDVFSSGYREGLALKSSAAVPANNGELKEVPEALA